MFIGNGKTSKAFTYERIHFGVALEIKWKIQYWYRTKKSQLFLVTSKWKKPQINRFYGVFIGIRENNYNKGPRHGFVVWNFSNRTRIVTKCSCYFLNEINYPGSRCSFPSWGRDSCGPLRTDPFSFPQPAIVLFIHAFLFSHTILQIG